MRNGIMLRTGQKLLEICPEWCFGKITVMKKKYQSRYGQRDWDGLIHKIRLRTAKGYFVLSIIFLLLIIFTLFNTDFKKTTVNEVLRPEYGEPSKNEILRAKVSYDDCNFEKEVNLKIPAVELTEDEKRQRLLAYIERLPILILGDNPSLDQVHNDLLLPIKESDSNILVEWVSDSPDILNEKGELDSLATKEGGGVNLTAIVSLGEVIEEASYYIEILPYEGKEHTRAIENRLSEIIDRLKEVGETEKILNLPDEIDTGIAIQWIRESKSSISVIICLLLFGYFVIFLKRYDGLERELKASKESIVCDFPDFIDKLVLLLNAGLVTNTALQKITSDYQRFRDEEKVKPLYEGLIEIQKRILETNAPLTKELREFAQKSGVRELARFANIVEDNINKGNTLTEKLEGEGTLLWRGKKKRAEEKGRLAETKLIFPLMLLLLVLILITIGPVMLEI